MGVVVTVVEGGVQLWAVKGMEVSIESVVSEEIERLRVKMVEIGLMRFDLMVEVDDDDNRDSAILISLLPQQRKIKMKMKIFFFEL